MTAVQILDPGGVAVCDIVRFYNASESLTVSGSDTFSSSASTTTGIASTSESVDESISGLYAIASYVVNKGLVAPGFSIYCANASLTGFIAIQADSLEELRGFI